MGSRDAGLVAKRAAAGAQEPCLGRHEAALAQQAIDAVPADAQALAITQIAPDAAVSPCGMLGLECLDGFEQGGVANGDRSGAVAFSHDHARRFFKLHGQFADERLEALVVPAQALFFGLQAALLEDLGAILQQAIPPLVILGLADLVTGAQLGQRHGGLESFEHDLQLLGTA